MGDDDYHKKLGEMQKYVPFLETTIKRLKSEKDKPREAQISKLQSLLVILTDSKKKLKLDALKKCEEVILKLYDKVEKKPPVTMMHKYMCRTPPEEKQHINITENNATFLVARQKLKQTEATPASPSPPLSPQINIAKPVVIPTEKIETPNQMPQNNWDNYQNIPQTLNWPVNAFNPQTWTMPPKKDIWDRDLIPSNTYKNKKIDREIINYSDTLDSSPTIKVVGNNKEIIPAEVPVKKPVSRKSLPLPPAPQSRKSLEKEILPLNKPPLTDKDLRDLLSPVTESSSGGHSPIFNEDMDLDKLEELKAKLCKELEDEKPKHKKKSKPAPAPLPVPPPAITEIKNPSPVVIPPIKKPVKVVERVIKEPDNVFGNLLSSIDEQIMGKKRLEKKPVTTKETAAKVMNIKDIASINEKVKSCYLKSEDSNKDKPRKPTKEEFKKPDEKPAAKEITIPKEIDDKVFKTVEDIMKNLKDSINKPAPDPLSKFGDLVKEKSDELCPVEIPPSGRLSDKYPHKRKSIDSRASDSPSSETKIEAAPPQPPPQPVKLTDPRLRTPKPNLISPPLKEPQNRNHNDFEQPRNFNKPPHNPEFSFQNSFNNMNNPNSFNNRGNNIFCNEPPSIPFLSPEGCRTPVDPFLNPREPFHNPEFMNAGPPRPRTPGDPFMNPPRTPVDPFMNRPRTPVDPFMSPGDPFLNQGRPPAPGPPNNCNFNQFPNEPMRNQFRNDFPMNHNWNNRPNQFAPNANQRFPPPPEQNQYDLSQMNPIDFYDNNNPNSNNRFEPPPPDFNNTFRGRGACNMRGNFVRGRGIPDRGRGMPDRGRGGGGGPDRGRGGGPDRYRDPRQFRNNGPPNKFPPNEEPPHKEDNRRSRFEDPRDSRDHRGDRDYRRSRFSKEEEHRSDRSRSTDDRYNRFSKREEPARKPGFVREDPRRKSAEESDKPKDKEVTVTVPETAAAAAAATTPVIDKPVEKSAVVEAKAKEEIQSPLDSLYSTETKRVGKGYGLQSFKIPKIKKTEEVKEDIKVEEVKEEPKKQEEEDPKPKEEIVKAEEKSPEKKEDVTPEAGPSKPTEEPKEAPKTEADLKLDMFNNFMKHIFETCDSSVLFQYLDRCGFSLPNAKTKRIRRIIDSDSSDTEDEHKKEDSETDKPTPEPPAETPEPEEPKTNEPEKIVETVSERIKSRRRKPILSSSDSSPDKSQKKAPTPDKEEEEEEEDTEKGPRKSRCRKPKQKVKTQAKSRRKNALELLQEDIREMFISEGVLTATGKRMCRMMKEHQESGFIAPEEEDPIKEQKDVTESEEEVPLVKRKEKLKTVKQEKSPEVPINKRATRKSPRVILEKIEISKADTTASTDHSEKESESENEMKKPNMSTRRTRRSNTVSGEFLELDENGVVAKVQEKKKKVKPKQSTTDETDALDTSFEDDASIKSDSHLEAASKKDETPTETGTDAPTEEEAPTTAKKKRIRRRGRGGWATGVIKNKKKKLKSLEKHPDSPALTVSTEKSDLQDSGSDEEEPKSKADTYEEEYSLLKVDTNEDVNYYLDNGNKFNCKLCDYKGKLIVHHYRSKHPESENMISRLSPEQASAAKIESKEFNFEEIIPYEEATKGKKRRTTFICRFCLLTFKQEFTCSFFDHICCHTGEYRYKCEKCAFSTGVKKTLSTHCHSLHPDMEKPLTIKPIYEGPPNFRLVFGYLCSACNFTQLLKENVEKHIRVSHPDQDITIIKVSMSTKPIPLTDLKKPEEEQASTEPNETEGEPMETTTTPESPKRKKPKGLESPKTPKKSLKTKPEPEAIEPKEPEAPKVPTPPPLPPPQKEKEPNLTVFMVPEGISEQEKLIESERLKKMEEIQSHVVPRRSKLQFVDKLKNKLDSVESEIALLESMEAENAALEAETPNLQAEEEQPQEEELEAPPEIPENFPEPEINDKPDDQGWISIASTCSLASGEQAFDEDPPEEPDLDTLDIPLSQNTKKTGFLDTIQRLAAQLQNNKTPSSLSDCEDGGERLYYSPEVTPESSPQRKAQLENAEADDAIKLNASCIEVQFFGNKNKYSCLIPGCYYTTYLKTSFRKHLMDEHKSLRVTCGLCVDENDLMEWDLCGLFLHMLDQHKQETPVKKASVQIKEEPLELPDIAIKSEVFSPEKQPESLQPGSIRLRRISGDLLSSFSSSENQIEYPTISIPEAVVSEPDISQLLGQEESPVNETGFLQISNVRTLTPEEETNLQIKTTPQSPKAFKKIIPKAIILNMGDLASSGVTKIVSNAGSAINLKRAPGKEGITYNFTLNASSEASPTLLTKTITSDNKPTKTIIFRKGPLDSGVPKLALLSPKTTLTKGFITTTGAKLKTSMASAKKTIFVTPAQIKPPPQQTVLKAPTTPEAKTIAPSPDKTKILQPLRLNKSEFILSIMTEYPKIMDFYKCPCLECIFTTNDRTKFQEHFNTHNRKLPGKYCVYCLSIIAPGDLIEHLERKHGSCNFQCALCFYRACFDMYIAVHQSFCHQIDIPKVYTIPPNVSLSKLAAGLDDGLLPRADAILPYYCTLDGCNRTFYTMNDFRVHMKIYHKRNNVCSICKFELNNSELLIGHYVTHNIANFQCRYCKFGSEKPQILLKHYAVEHYNKNPIVYKREYKSGIMSAHPNDAARLDDIVEINLSYLVKTNRCIPQKLQETQNHIPAATSSFADEQPMAVTSTCAEEAPAPLEEDTEPSGGSGEANEAAEDTEDTEELLIDPATGELIPATDKNGLTEPEITLKHRNEESLKAIVDAVDPLNLDDEAAEETDIYEDSGLSGCELFVCGTSDCAAKLANLKDFKDHLYSCDVLTRDEGWYTCFHCKKRFKYVGALIKHLTVHGPQKYTCSLCPAKSHQETLILKHMKVQHKIPLAKVVPVDKSAADTEFLAVAIKPRAKKSKKDDELYEKELQDAIKHTREQIELIENPTKPVKIADDKNSFGPEDIDKLPRPPIFAQEVKCKICSYNTKVRTNMLIHLKAHIENKPVAETAPVNPVPCLEKNELMFDKMTNLAASSHSGGRMGGTKPDKVRDKTLVLDYPKFVAASKRYVCGSTGCNYLTHGDSMLRHHLTALHIDEVSYKCPHCHLDLAPDGLTVLAVDNILFHLKMHDLHLYKCNECPFYHYQKHKMEKHLVDEHPLASKSSFAVIRELDNSANLEETRPPPPLPKSPEKAADPAEEPQPWRCGFCDYKTATRTAVQGHAAVVHKIRSQFKCGSCEFRCSAKNNYQAHYKNKHPTEKVVILSVYYKVTDESSSNLSSSDVEPATSQTITTTTTTAGGAASFDTTPLWTKNRTGVKHIRGILLDDSPVSKRPKIIEKLSENADDEKAKAKPKSPQKSAETGHNLRFPANFGTPRERFFVCPTCNTYETKNSKQFVIHLYKEINYFRYMCNFCAHKSTHMAEAQKHFKERHSTEVVVSNKQICTVLRYYAKAEKWVEKCLQVQQEKIRSYETDSIKQETVNSSTETLLLQLDPETPETPEKEETTPEKPLLTPQQHQQHRRSSRATIKPNLNENDESFESTELSPPVLEPEMPDLKAAKKSVLKCDHCPFVAKAPANLNKHVRKHFEAKPYKCSLCSYVGSQLAHLQSHFYFKHTSEPLQYTLDPIPEVPQARPLKRKRQASETTDEPMAVVKAEPMDGDLEPPANKIKTEGGVAEGAQFYVCFHCPRRSPTLDLIRDHFMEAHEKIYKNIFKYKKLTIDKPKKTKYSCRFCAWTGQPDGMKQHHIQNHVDKEYAFLKDILFKCAECSEVFNKRGLLKKHFYRAHPNRNLIYQNITKENDDEYIETIEVIEELLEIKSEAEINCQYCVLSFGCFAEVRAHHDLVHGHLEFTPIDEDRDELDLKKFKCPQCHHTSNSFPAMRDHLRNHNKPYKCGHCDLSASYPNVIRTHHMKEHLSLEPLVLILPEAQKRNEELRDNLLHLLNGEYVKIKENLKRAHADTLVDEQPPHKLLAVDEDKKPKAKRRKSVVLPVIKQKANVAKKSTATPPRHHNVAKKSTTPRPYVDRGFSYYGTRPLLFDDIKNIRTELPIMGKNVSLNVASVSQIFQLFPVVVLDDIGKTNI